LQGDHDIQGPLASNNLKFRLKTAKKQNYSKSPCPLFANKQDICHQIQQTETHEP